MIKQSYQVNASGQFVLCMNGQAIASPIPTVCMSIDSVDGTLQAHGTTERVTRDHQQNLKALRAMGCTSWANNLVLVDGVFPVDEINHCMAVQGYGKFFLDKLNAGKFNQPQDDQPQDESLCLSPSPAA